MDNTKLRQILADVASQKIDIDEALNSLRDFPYVDLDKALTSFDKMNFKQPVKEKILFANARALFNL